MFTVRYATKQDKPFWFTLDTELPEYEFLRKVRDKRCYILSDGDKPIGIMRYNFAWDIFPFLTLIHIKEAYHFKGFGKQAIQYWEEEMRNLGFKMVLTSTQANEEAQHFYRKLGYIDKGCLLLDNTPYAQPAEIFLVKVL